MHSRIGPWTEANTVYVGQSGAIFESRCQDWVTLYDVGMGIAANALAAVAALRERRTKLRIFSFERDPQALACVLESKVLAFQRPYRGILEELLARGSWRSPFLEWSVIPGDFREARLAALPSADLVYFDFYAPQTCPELWAAGVFARLREKMREDGLLITYASSKAARASMLLAGFCVGAGSPTPMKSTTTVASPRVESLARPLDGRWLEGLARSTKPLPEGWETLKNHRQFVPDQVRWRDNRGEIN